MRNILFVLVFVSITILSCGENNSLLEKCADRKTKNYFKKIKKFGWEEFLKKSYKEKLQYGSYENYHLRCEEERMFAPETFKVKWQ